MGEMTEEEIPSNRERGWLDALTAAGVPRGPIKRGPFTHEGGHELCRELLASSGPPTAIFASSDRLATGVLRAIRQQQGTATPPTIRRG
jgi:LacI family transcriptional regulator